MPNKERWFKTFIFIPSGNYSSASEEARKKFLHAIKTIDTSVLSTLAENVFPLYRLLYRTDFKDKQDYLRSGSILVQLCYAEAYRVRAGLSENPLFESDYRWAFASQGLVFFPEDTLPLNEVVQDREILYLIGAPLISKERTGRVRRWHEYIEMHIREMQEIWDGQTAFRLMDAFREWAWKWHLPWVSSGWFMDYVLQTLYSWCENDSITGIDWEYNLKGIRVVEMDPDESFNFWFPPCDLRTEKWGEYERRLRQAFDIAKRQYEARIYELATQSKQNLALSKYSENHYEWLTRFQVQEWSKNRIAQYYTVDRKTVREAINSTAALIGLDLRNPQNHHFMSFTSMMLS